MSRLRRRCGEQVEDSGEQIESQAVEDRIFERILAVGGLHRVRKPAEEVDAEGDPDQIVDEQEAGRRRRPHGRQDDVLDGGDHRPEPGQREHLPDGEQSQAIHRFGANRPSAKVGAVMRKQTAGISA